MYVWILIIIAIYCILPISFMNYIILYIIFIMILIPISIVKYIIGIVKTEKFKKIRLSNSYLRLRK